MIRRAALLAASCIVAAVAVAACSSSSGGGGPTGSISSGVYRTFDAVADGADPCGMTAAFGADVASLTSANLTVVVSGATLTLGGLNGTDNGGNLVALLSSSVDFNTDPFGLGPLDCVADEILEYKGKTIGLDQAKGSLKVGFINNTGTQCGQVLTGIGGSGSMPCTGATKFSMFRIADPPSPVTGTVTTATGGGTTLVDDFNAQDLASTLNVHLDVGTDTVDFADNFDCYSPTAMIGVPPVSLVTTSGYYEFGDYFLTFAAEVTSAAWVAGSVPVAQGAAVLHLNLKDAAGDSFVMDATGGSFLLNAPTTSGGACSFSMTNVPISGTKIPVVPPAPVPHRLNTKSRIKNLPFHTN